MKRLSLPLIVLGLLLVAGTSPCWAQEEPSQVIVIRAANDTLWMTTCTDNVLCTDWSLISGLFTNQPTLSWNDDLSRYILYGRGTDGAVWRSTINRLGDHEDNWISLGGLTPNPVAAAGRGTVRVGDTTQRLASVIVSSGTIVQVGSVSLICPFDGYLVATATGVITASFNETTFISLTQTHLTVDLNTATQYRASHSADIESFAHSRQFSCQTPGTQEAIYLSAVTDSGATQILNAHLQVEYYAYAY